MSKLILTFCAFFLSGVASFAQSLDDRLLVHLPLATDFDDASSNSVRVAVTGNVRIDAEGAYFPGEQDWLRLPHLPFNGKAFSVAMWVKVTGRNPMYGLLHQHESWSDNHWLHLMFRGGLQPYLGFYNNDAISPLAIERDRWFHLVFQYDGKHQQLWVNGGLLCSRESRPYDGAKGPTYVGRSPEWNNVPSKNFEGFMRELRIYERALSGAEIRKLVGLQEDLQTASRELLTDPLLSNALAADVGIPFLEISGEKLLITGESKQIYEVSASSDINAGFQPVATLTNTFGRVEFVDTAWTPNRFYSVRLKR